MSNQCRSNPPWSNHWSVQGTPCTMTYQCWPHMSSLHMLLVRLQTRHKTNPLGKSCKMSPSCWHNIRHWTSTCSATILCCCMPSHWTPHVLQTHWRNSPVSGIHSTPCMQYCQLVTLPSTQNLRSGMMNMMSPYRPRCIWPCHTDYTLPRRYCCH